MERLVLELIDPQAGIPLQRWQFEGDRQFISIGRAADCDVWLTDRLVSRYHATLRQEGGVWYLDVLGANGCCLDGNFTIGSYLADDTTLSIGISGPVLKLTIDRMAGVGKTSQSSLAIEVFRRYLIQNEVRLLSSAGS